MPLSLLLIAAGAALVAWLAREISGWYVVAGLAYVPVMLIDFVYDLTIPVEIIATLFFMYLI